MATVMGVSGSPVPNSNTDRAVKAVLEATGLDTSFFKLSEMTLEPCRACLACVRTGRCVVRDDGAMLAEGMAQARAVVVGGFTPYSSLDARTKTFLERMYCHRHGKGGNGGKVTAAVIVSAITPRMAEAGLPPAAQTAESQFRYWAMEEGMKVAGVARLTGNLPCIRCGLGDTCPASGVKMLHGPDATVADLDVRDVDEDPAARADLAALGRAIREALEAAPAPA